MPGAAQLIAGDGGGVHDHLRGGGRAGVGAVELAELPLASQHPQRVVDRAPASHLQVGVLVLRSSLIREGMPRLLSLDR